MELTQIIKKPILTEKTNNLQEHNTYTFEVYWAANKYQIKEAIEFIFKVKVVKVNTSKVDKKPKKLGRFAGFENRYKKAVVTLADGYSISYYPNEAEKQDKKANKGADAAKKAKDTEANKAKEAKLAEKMAAKKAKASKEEAPKEASKPAAKKETKAAKGTTKK